MYKIKESTIKNSLKPFDIVKTQKGEIAFIKEVSLNSCQKLHYEQVSYSLKFITKNNVNEKTAWYKNHELELLGNLFIKIAEITCNKTESDNVELLFNNIQSSRGISY
jgi:hypothetical protein